ncbi:hypothetical protein [Lonepinella sp. BR2882]|uniref:hypothetical protein n=1 Tax=Lonepinella sp. BR2882 TaxID=3095283 RepID=UPI003F6E0C65
MSQKFNFQEYISQIPQLNSEKDIDTFFNVMNVVANLPLPIDQKTALLQQMESKLKDNPKFQEIADSHKPQMEKIQQVMANFVQNVAEKKEQVNKQQQEIKNGQQFNLQQLNMLKGYELVKYITEHITDASQWAKIGTENQNKAINYIVNHTDLNDPEQLKDTAKIAGYAATNEENLNTLLEEFRQAKPERRETLLNNFRNNPEFQTIFKRCAHWEDNPEMFRLFVDTLSTINSLAYKNSHIQVVTVGNMIRTIPDNEETRLKFRHLMAEQIAKETDPAKKRSLESISNEIIFTELKSKDLFNNKDLLNKPADEIWGLLKNQLNKSLDICKKFDSNSKWDIISLFKSDHNTNVGQLLHSQLTLYLAGDNKDILNNVFFRELYEKSKAQGNDHFLFKNALTGMWFGGELADKIIELLDKDLKDNPELKPDHTMIDQQYVENYKQDKDKYYPITMAVTSINKNIKDTEVYDVFRKINNGETLTDKELSIVKEIKRLEKDPDFKHDLLISGREETTTNREILNDFYQATHFTPDQILEKHNKNENTMTHMSEDEKKILAVADIDKSKQVANELQKQANIVYSQSNIKNAKDEDDKLEDILAHKENINNGDLNI